MTINRASRVYVFVAVLVALWLGVALLATTAIDQLPSTVRADTHGCCPVAPSASPGH
jgi:hypothetical protein